MSANAPINDPYSIQRSRNPSLRFSTPLVNLAMRNTLSLAGDFNVHIGGGENRWDWHGCLGTDCLSVSVDCIASICVVILTDSPGTDTLDFA